MTELDDVQKCCMRIQPLLLFVVCVCIVVCVGEEVVFCYLWQDDDDEEKTDRKTNSKADKALIMIQPNPESTCVKTIEMSIECTKVKLFW